MISAIPCDLSAATSYVAAHLTVGESSTRPNLCQSHALELLTSVAEILAGTTDTWALAVTEHGHPVATVCPGISPRLRPDRCYAWVVNQETVTRARTGQSRPLAAASV